MADTKPVWNIFGNATAVRRLKTAAVSGPRHAYLLAGPDSIGKNRLARAFAAAMLCQHPPSPGDFCGTCSTCRRVFKGVHPDVIRFDLAYQAAQDDGASRNLSLNIKTVREVGRHVALRPAEGSWRVVVVDDVETMQEPAQEAFLKTLEEPPSYVVLVLLCTDAELLLPTIRSRCETVPMTTSPDAVVRAALTSAGASEADADGVTMAAGGQVGLALRAMGDRALLDEMTGHIDAASSWVAGDEHQRMVEAFRLADQFSSSREAVFSRLIATQVAWRQLVLARAEIDTKTSHPITTRGRVATLGDGVTALVAIDRCIRDLEANVRPRSAVAAMVSAWPELVTT